LRKATDLPNELAENSSERKNLGEEEKQKEDGFKEFGDDVNDSIEVININTEKEDNVFLNFVERQNVNIFID
jgi:hypothetical protein